MVDCGCYLATPPSIFASRTRRNRMQPVAGSKARIYQEELAAAITATIIHPWNVFAAPASLKAELLEAPYRKTIDELDSELTRGPATAVEARTTFLSGLSALEAYDFQEAAIAFERSRAALETYSATFNEAFARQIDRDYSEAEELYDRAEQIRGRDVELQVNRAFIFARKSEFQLSDKAFDQAVMLAKDSGLAVKGRVLLQRGLTEYDRGSRQSALNNLGLADKAFAEADDMRGRAVVAAKRGNALLAQRHSVENEHLLLDAIRQLEAVGASVDEASARTDLANRYLGADLNAQAKTQLVRAVELASTANHMLQLGRSLNDLGISQGVAQSGDVFRRAIGSFQRARDRVGEGEARNNLGLA
jgi:hypothetical protein